MGQLVRGLIILPGLSVLFDLGAIKIKPDVGRVDTLISKLFCWVRVVNQRDRSALMLV